MNKNIYLIGFMGVGKSTITKKLSELLKKDALEMDEMIVKRQGMPISEIFEKHGEEYFRDVESALLEDIKNNCEGIVSCGGGAVLRDKNAAVMKDNGKIILLTATPQTIYERVKDNNDRPILNGNMNVEYIEGLMAKRRDRYFEVADIIVETDNKDVDTICREIMDKLGLN